MKLCKTTEVWRNQSKRVFVWSICASYLSIEFYKTKLHKLTGKSVEGGKKFDLLNNMPTEFAFADRRSA